MASPKQLAAVAFATFLTATASAQPGLGDLLAQADANEDGAISREEFVQARSKQFAGLDTDTSNALSEAEFAVALEGTPMRRFSSRAFSRADKNDDGELTQGEWDALPTRAFDRMDRNDSGQIEIDELPDRES
ncbi:MAG: hypothetical protein AAF098_15750 [Pseudomonadota bacterium]